jgi:hypothetical protein
MPICQKCSSQFPNRFKIEGKNKNLQNRKYCLTCSPYGKHNTKKIHEDNSSHKERICNSCVRTYYYQRKKGHTLSTCNSCYVKNKRKSVKQDTINKMGGKCSICGYNKSIFALQFHHLDPSKKIFNVSANLGKYSLQSIKNEIEKCIVVCANCHFEIHGGATEA